MLVMYAHITRAHCVVFHLCRIMATQILAFLAVGTLVGLHVSAQLPSVCVPVNSTRECCPDNCGGPAKGECVDIDIMMNNGICDVRYSSA